MNMPLVTLEGTSEDDDRRYYSVADLVEGLTVSVIATKEGSGEWSCQCEPDARVSSSEQNDAIALVYNHIMVLQHDAAEQRANAQANMEQMLAEADSAATEDQPKRVRKPRAKPKSEAS